MTHPKERRQHPRHDVRVSAGVRRAGETAIAVTTLNVGAGGVYVEVPHFIEPLTKLQVALDLPSPAGPVHVEADAIVVRTQPEQPSSDRASYEVACAFLGMSDEHRAAIHRWVAAQKVPTTARR